jgi:hypothetical protein
MRWHLALHPEVIDSPDQPFPKMMLPNPVHDYPRRERSGPVIQVRNPFGQGAALLR